VFLEYRVRVRIPLSDVTPEQDALWDRLTKRVGLGFAAGDLTDLEWITAYFNPGSLAESVRETVPDEWSAAGWRAWVEAELRALGLEFEYVGMEIETGDGDGDGESGA
jgi:hypothetical protein